MTYDLEVASHGIVAGGDLEVSGSKYIDGNSGETKNTGEDGIGLEGEDEIGGKGETPDDQVETDGRVEVGACSTFSSVAGW